MFATKRTNTMVTRKGTNKNATEVGYISWGNAASKPFQADVNFAETSPTVNRAKYMHLAPVREILRSGEMVGLGSVMVKRVTGSRETTSTGGAEV
jgi:hypothetical protein